ncbi:flagellar motor switch protein FliN [Chromatium okenii]|uniref:flagellar motor switch protein FliN n=1 Tax=Chromatium okenii TaxID=61644 RepID=UPI0019046A6E|nr:flagellar motor switch protein FliN [Chromatium okenii]MBK1641874.1 flagellar motor switch protein FliN [Chromatium okenii]
MSTDSDTDLGDAVADDWAMALEEQKEATEPSIPDPPAAKKPQGRERDGDALNGGKDGNKPQPKLRRFGEETMDSLRAQPLNPDDFSNSSPTALENLNLNMLLDVPVTISMEIGRSRITIRNLLQLNQGSVVELDRLAGAPLDVLVNGTLIAHGEVVVVNEKFGIRLTDVISPSERVRKLRQ